MTRLSLVLPLVLAVSALGSPVAAQAIGANAVVINDVRISTQAEPAVHRARVRERVSIGNPIHTGAASQLQLLLLDGTSFQIGSNARLVVDRFVYDANRSASAVGAEVAQGSFRFISGRPTHARPGETQIRTPAASIGVRGTIIEGAVGQDAIDIARFELGVPSVAGADPAGATLAVLRGPAAGVNGERGGAFDITAGGATVPVEVIGYAVFVPAEGQRPIGPFLISDNGLAELATLLGDPRRGIVTPDSTLLAIDPMDFEEVEEDPQSTGP